MPFYHRLGVLPRVKHTAFRREGGGLFCEELFSSKGFAGPYSTRYHLLPPPQLLRATEVRGAAPREWSEAPLECRHLWTDRTGAGGDFIAARRPLLFNAQTTISVAAPDASSERFYRNAQAGEFVFVHRGRGELQTDFGALRFEEGDQLVIPRSVTWRLALERPKDAKLLVVESRTPFEIPAQYRGASGQLLEMAPYSERDLKLPSKLEARDEKGEFTVMVKAGERLFEHVVPHHPFDVVGWDGYLFPYALNLRDFHPKVGRIHLPPPAHLAFATEAAALCDFVPRPFDFHPEAVPVPYYHSNLDCDEVIYYVEGDFMSRKGVAPGSLTWHPAGLAHGPQPGKVEASIGAKQTHEYAVMIDTFEPLRPTVHARAVLDPGYAQSWL